MPILHVHHVKVNTLIPYLCDQILLNFSIVLLPQAVHKNHVDEAVFFWKHIYPTFERAESSS